MTESKTVAGAYAKIEAHEDLCAERYQAINGTLMDLKSTSKDQARVQWGVLLALLGFLALQVWNNSQARIDRLEHPAPVQGVVVR